MILSIGKKKKAPSFGAQEKTSRLGAPGGGRLWRGASGGGRPAGSPLPALLQLLRLFLLCTHCPGAPRALRPPSRRSEPACALQSPRGK